jgi:hypothetical protein
MDGYSVFKDIGIPSLTFLIGLFVNSRYEKRKGKQGKLDAIDAHIVSLIKAAEDGTVYIARFYLNELLRGTRKFCVDYKIKIDIDPELSDLSIACTSGTLDKELATSASINLINKIKNAV